MTELSKLPPAERAARYRELAENARRDARKSTGEHGDALRELAKAWGYLAELSEQLGVKNATLAGENEVEQKQAAMRAPPKSNESSD